MKKKVSIEELISKFDDPDPKIIIEAVEALVKIGEPAVLPLIEAWCDKK